MTWEKATNQKTNLHRIIEADSIDAAIEVVLPMIRHVLDSDVDKETKDAGIAVVASAFVQKAYLEGLKHGKAGTPLHLSATFTELLNKAEAASKIMESNLRSRN